MEGGVPSEQTEVRVVFDEDNLYISAILYGDPADILAYSGSGMPACGPTTASCGSSTPSWTGAPDTSSRSTRPD